MGGGQRKVKGMCGTAGLTRLGQNEKANVAVRCGGVGWRTQRWTGASGTSGRSREEPGGGKKESLRRAEKGGEVGDDDGLGGWGKG